MEKIIALLPMKGNSERVPNKNMKLFDGKPLYHIIAHELQESVFISNVLVNTDSKIIKDNVVSNFPDFVILDREKNICGDFVSMNEIIKQDILNMEADLYFQTHSTNPLLTSKTIDNAISQFLLNKKKYDSAFSVTKLQTRLYNKKSQAINHDMKKLVRTQDLSPVFEENSNFYIFSKKSFFDADHQRIGLNPLMYEIEKLEAIDIDEQNDFIIAEQIYKWRKAKK